MPKRCTVFNCRANYDGEPYSQVVSFPTDTVERTRWIEAMPNEPGSLKDRKEIYVFSSHFECEEESDQLNHQLILRCAQVLSEADYYTSKANKKGHFCYKGSIAERIY